MLSAFGFDSLNLIIENLWGPLPFLVIIVVLVLDALIHSLFVKITAFREETLKDRARREQREFEQGKIESASRFLSEMILNKQPFLSKVDRVSSVDLKRVDGFEARWHMTPGNVKDPWAIIKGRQEGENNPSLCVEIELRGREESFSIHWPRKRYLKPEKLWNLWLFHDECEDDPDFVEHHVNRW